MYRTAGTLMKLSLRRTLPLKVILMNFFEPQRHSDTEKHKV